VRRPLKALVVLIPAVTLGLLALPTVAGAAPTPPPPASFSFSGAGWGHGVGMSQYGAKGQADEGRSATQILQHYYTGSRVAAFRDDVDLRVSLAYLASTVRMRVESIGAGTPGLQVALGGAVVKAGVGDMVELGVKGSAMVVRIDGVVKASGPSAVIRWSGTRTPGSTGSAPSVLNLVSGGKSLDTSGHRYRYGQVEARARYSPVAGATVISAVNVVRLHDEYVFGIGEMPSSWPSAALQAQAIASRGYALVKYRQGVRSGCWCHVFADTSDQVFVGWSKQAGPSGARWTAAVKATNTSPTTSSMVLVGGVPAQTFFFSSSGGRTQNSEDVWGSKLTYLRSVDDRWSLDRTNNPNAAWGPRMRTQQQVASAFGLPNVARLDLSDRYASGAVRLAKAWSTGGTYAEVSGVKLVSRLGLTSRWYRITGASSPTPAPSAFRVTLASTQVKTGVAGRLTGTVWPADRSAGSTVSLRRWDATKKVWAYAGGATVTRTGAFAFNVSGRWPDIRQYKVYKPAKRCGTTCVIRAAVSPPAKVAIVGRYEVAAVAPVAVVRAGAALAVRGEVSPARLAAGSAVSIKRYDSVRGWVSAGNARIDRSGRFSVSLAGVPAGRHRLTVFKAKDRCVGTICTMLSARSTDIPVTVQRPLSVKVSATSKARRSLTVTGTVAPAAASAGGRAVIQRMVGGQWVVLGPARIGTDGRFAKTFTNLPLRPMTLRVWTSGSSCVNTVCVNPAGASAALTVTPRSK
jgi:SpoIID/LytB domain protein